LRWAAIFLGRFHFPVRQFGVLVEMPAPLDHLRLQPIGFPVDGSPQPVGLPEGGPAQQQGKNTQGNFAHMGLGVGRLESCMVE
jgi:hypothetical protein